MHEAAREHNRQHPEPTLKLDLCGYEYAILQPDQEFTCSGCGRKRTAVLHESAKLEIAFNDPSAPMGRRQQPFGYVCGVICAERAFGTWYWRRRA